MQFYFCKASERSMQLITDVSIRQESISNRNVKAPFRQHKNVPKFIPEFFKEFVPEFDLNSDLCSGTNSGMMS